MAGEADERMRRWRLALGGYAADGTGVTLAGGDLGRDRAMAAVYDAGEGGAAKAGKRSGGLGGSAPSVARWLGDVREFFPQSVVRVLQQDAMDRLDLKRLLLEPEMLETVDPDPRLVADLLSLSGILPAKAKETARAVVRRCVREVERRLAEPLRQAVSGALNRSARNRRPRHNEVDWDRTIRANLRHYQAEYRTVIPETRIGFGRRRSGLRDVILCLDQSGSMATSVVYAGILGAVLASLPAIRTRVVAFDTGVVDLTEELSDPVEVLFGTQLGGGTDIDRALAYCQGLVRRPAETVLVLVSDLIEGGVRENLIRRAAALIASGVTLVTLLALSDDGAPVYDRRNAADLAGLGSPAFACTPDLFPDLMAAALNRQDLGRWAADHGVVASRPGEDG